MLTHVASQVLLTTRSMQYSYDVAPVDAPHVSERVVAIPVAALAGAVLASAPATAPVVNV